MQAGIFGQLTQMARCTLSSFPNTEDSFALSECFAAIDHFGPGTIAMSTLAMELHLLIPYERLS